MGEVIGRDNRSQIDPTRLFSTETICTLVPRLVARAWPSATPNQTLWRNTRMFAPTILTPMGSLGVLAGTAVMTYYATSADGYRFGMADAETGEVALTSDVRLWVAAGSMLAGRFLPLPPMVGDLTHILGISAFASLAATEGLRWKEDGKLLGFTAPALPALDAPAA
jgi:hypothetical protein